MKQLRDLLGNSAIWEILEGENTRKLIEFYENEFEGCVEDDDIFAPDRSWRTEVSLLGLVADGLENEDTLVVDAGCGIGLDICALAHLFTNKGFIGYDISQRKIDLARKRAKRLGNTNVEFYVRQHQQLLRTIKPNSVDVAYFKLPLFSKERDSLDSRYAYIREALRTKGTLIRICSLNTHLIRMEEIPGFEHPEVFGRAFYSISLYRKVES